jgi:hypothetical protein
LRPQHGGTVCLRRELVLGRLLPELDVQALPLPVGRLLWHGRRGLRAVRDGPEVQHQHREVRLRRDLVPVGLLQWIDLRPLRLAVGHELRDRRRGVRLVCWELLGFRSLRGHARLGAAQPQGHRR